MKIAIVAHLKYPIAEPFAGGLEAHTFALARGLRCAGHDVVLFAAEGSEDFGLNVVCAPTGSLSASAADVVEDAAYRKIIGELQSDGYDIVHFNALHPLPIDDAASIPAPFVTVLHCPPFQPFERAVKAGSQKITWVSVSRTLSQQWPSLPSEPYVVENGVDLFRFRFEEKADEPRFALWCGRIVREKGLQFAIDAARRAGVTLKICGPIADRAYWESEIAPLLWDGAVYLDHLPHDGVAAVMGKASVLVCSPCWDEPFGLVVVEALACGTPVAGFARGALCDILDETCGTLAEPDDVVALSRAIQTALALRRGDCRKRAERFSVERMVARYESLYHSLCTELETERDEDVLDDADAG